MKLKKISVTSKIIISGIVIAFAIPEYYVLVTIITAFAITFNIKVIGQIRKLK